MVGARLGDTGCNRAHAHFRHQLDRNIGCRIDVFQVVDELRQIFNRVDVMVRRRRNEANTRRGVAGLGDGRIDLVPRKLAAFAGLCALRNLDLDQIGIDEIFRRHTETARGHLLDCRAFRVRRAIRQRVETIRLLAALAGVRLAANGVHRAGKRGMRLSGDRAEGHGAG